MRAFLFALLPLLALASNDDFSHPTVEVLTAANFDARIMEAGQVFVKFYSPRCIHCKRLAPTWHELGDALQDAKGIVIAQIDATKERELASRFNIRSYPTLRHFAVNEDSREVELRFYSGPRTLSSLVDFAKSGWRSSPIRQVADDDSPHTFSAIMGFATRHPFLAGVFMIASVAVVVGVIMLVIDLTMAQDGPRSRGPAVHDAESGSWKYA